MSEMNGALDEKVLLLQKEKVLVLQNNQLTVNLQQSDTEDFHPDEDLDGILPRSQEQGEAYQKVKDIITQSVSSPSNSNLKKKVILKSTCNYPVHCPYNRTQTCIGLPECQP